jgi:hypothetical protein
MALPGRQIRKATVGQEVPRPVPPAAATNAWHQQALRRRARSGSRDVTRSAHIDGSTSGPRDALICRVGGVRQAAKRRVLVGYRLWGHPLFARWFKS